MAFGVPRRTRPDLPRSFKTPFVPVLPIASVLASFYLMLNLPAATWIRFAIWLVIGLVVYGFYGSRRSRVGIAAAGTGGPDVIDLRDNPGEGSTRADSAGERGRARRHR